MKSQRRFPRIKPFIKWVRVSEKEISIYDPSTCAYYTMQSGSTRVWELLDGEHSITQIASVLIGDMNATEDVVDQLSREILVLLETLEKRGMIEYNTPERSTCRRKKDGDPLNQERLV